MYYMSFRMWNYCTIENGMVVNVTGNTCPRGKKYSESECVNPQRTITSTVRCADGGLISVKTSTTIPKEKMEECMKIINSVKVSLPVSIGDVIIEDVFGSHVVATQNRI